STAARRAIDDLVEYRELVFKQLSVAHGIAQAQTGSQPTTGIRTTEPPTTGTATTGTATTGTATTGTATTGTARPGPATTSTATTDIDQPEPAWRRHHLPVVLAPMMTTASRS